MAYARQTYTDNEVRSMIEGGVNTSVTSGEGGRGAPDPHAALHAPTDELHAHPLFQRARVRSGDVPRHSVVVNTDALVTNLRTALNSAGIQAHLARLDPQAPRAVDPTWHPGRIAAVTTRNQQAARNPQPQHNNVWINVNFAAPQGVVNEFTDGGGGGGTPDRTFNYQCLGIKLKINPRNLDVPILQTCVPTDTANATGFHVTI